MIYKMPIIGGSKVDITRYASGLKKDKKYKDAIDATLTTLSESLNLSFSELYNGLFFNKGQNAKGIMVIK